MGRGWVNTIKTAVAQQKGKLFTKLAREIAVAAKLGGPDPDGNARLKLAIDNARAASCPKDTIERAIKKGSGQLDSENIEELTYEGYGPHKVGVIVECQTSNKNRTVSEIRNIFKSHGGAMGENGSVAWMFDRVCLVVGVKANIGDPEEDAIEVGANEVEKNNDTEYSFYGAIEDLDTIRKGLNSRTWQVSTAELSYKPKNVTELTEAEQKEVIEFLKELEDNDDTHRVHATIK